MRERPLSHVPRPVLALLMAALLLQLCWRLQQPLAQAKAENLPAPPSMAALRVASFGEPIALSKILMLYVQAFDNQPGVQLSFRQLDFAQLTAWLSDIIDLDPQSQYPLFAASRLYGEVADGQRQREMLDFVYREFLRDPNHRWTSMAHAAYLARHRLKDMELARRYAQALRLHATGSEVPGWAKQMEIFLLEDMNELDAARILLGGLLTNGEITDPHELRFLQERLVELEKKQKQAP